MAIKNSWASGEVLTAADLTDTMKGVYINAQTASYTFGTADGFVTLSNASGGTATIPANATAAFNTGAVIGVMNAGTAGSFTIGTAAGVTLNAVSGTTTLAPLESATLVKLATNTWQLARSANQSAWTTWTPVVTQSVNVTVTNERSVYMRVGALVIASFRLTVTGSGTANNSVTMSLPVASATSTPMRIGSVFIYDASATTAYVGVPNTASTTSVSFLGDWSQGSSFGISPNLGLSLNDQISGTLIYEGA